MTLRQKICDSGVSTLREYICTEQGIPGDIIYNGTIQLALKKGLSLDMKKDIILEEQKIVLHKKTDKLVLAAKVAIVNSKEELAYGCI